MTSTSMRDELVANHREYARKLAIDLSYTLPRGLDRDDLVSSAYEGLLEAASRFDPKRGVKFSTFAYYRIRGAMFDFARKHLGTDAGARARINGALANDDAIEAAQEMIARDAGDGPVEAATALVGIIETSVAIFTVVEAAAAVATPRSGSPEGQVAALEGSRVVQEAINALPEKERTMIQCVYFLGENIMEAGKRLGLSKSWACRLHQRAIDMLREKLEAARDALR